MPVKQIVTTLLFYFFFVSVKGQTSRALLVAIDKYPSESGWNEIHATNDIYLLKPLLIKRNFAPAHVTVLLNEQATKDAIVKALKQLAKDSRHGDYIYIHFSCHGQQMADDNGDETDGLDEALIPYDAPRRYQKGVYVGEKHLRDDELGSLWEIMRKNESLPFSRLCELLKNRVDELKPRRGKTQIPLLKTNDEKGIFRIGI